MTGLMPRRQEDRRQQPRRHEEATLHYAREALTAAALLHADNYDASPYDRDKTEAQLRRAVEAYRWAETQVAAADRQPIR